MKEPIEGDFDVKVEGANVRVTFNPTNGASDSIPRVSSAIRRRRRRSTSLGVDTHWSNTVRAMAGQLTKKALCRGWLRKTLIGSAIGAGFGFPKTFIAGAIGASIGFIFGLSIGLTYPESLGPKYSQIITRYSASLQPTNEKNDTSLIQPDASFTQADVEKAKQAATIIREEYRKCLGAEASRSINISAQEFSLFIQEACLTERNKYAVQLIDAISITSDSPDDIAAAITSANNLIDQIQAAAVSQFTRRSGQ
jgi:hypothetical protein